MMIKISSDYTDSPGARYRADGPFSGEDFYESLLKPKFEECLKNKDQLLINFDDCFGFASSFLDESFGRLSTDFGMKTVKKHLVLVSVQDPLIIEQVIKIIENPRREK